MIDKLNKLRENSSEEGFTLVELMIVVVIIAILAAISIPIFANQQKSAVIAGVKSDVKNTVTNIATALAKDPTAWPIKGDSSKDASIKVGILDVTADFVKSDPHTVIVVDGQWNNYKVTGSNTYVGTGEYWYDASTGKYTGKGDFK